MNRPPADPAETDRLRRNFGRAWVALAAALALHVADEALHDFLSVYNPAVHAIRGRLPWLPLPTFTFWPWIIGLALGIVLLFLLSPRARRGDRWVVIVGLPLSAIMVGNALGHIGGSMYLHRLLPGVYSSPILLGVAVSMLVFAVRLFRLTPRRVSPKDATAKAR
jgi:hypothetical protein